jgi:hypothetical protein
MALRFNIPFLKMQGPMNIRAYRLSATTQNTNTPLHLHRLSDLPISGVGALHIAPPIYHLTQSCHNQLTTMKHRVQKRSPYTVSGYRHLKKRLLTTHNIPPTITDCDYCAPAPIYTKRFRGASAIAHLTSDHDHNLIYDRD